MGDGDEGIKDFFLEDVYFGRYICEDGGFDEEIFVVCRWFEGLVIYFELCVFVFIDIDV